MAPSLMDWKVYESEDSPAVLTNYHTMSRYLGRVNLVSLLPTALLLFSMFWAMAGCLTRRKLEQEASLQKQTKLFLLTVIILSFSSYLWFLILYPDIGKGDTIKASYQLHIFPLMAIIAGFLLHEIAQKSKVLFYGILLSLLLVAVHNFYAMVTHFPLFPVFWDK